MTTDAGLDFDEVLINLQGSKPRWYSEVNPSGQTPCVRTAEGRVITESLRIIEMLDDLFPECTHRILPEGKDREDAVTLMHSFSAVFPSGTRPSSRGSFLYKGSRPLPRAEFEATLDRVDGMLSEREGPFFLGPSISGVDCAYAPFLERWSQQVPALIGLQTRDERWPHLARWYDALETRLPAYSHRVQGDRHTWRMALAGAGGGATTVAEEGDVPEWLQGQDSCLSASAAEFVARAPLTGPTGASAARDAAARLVANRDAVVSDAARRALGLSCTCRAVD